VYGRGRYEEGFKFLAQVVEGGGSGGAAVGLSCVRVEA
jgi:hypothetical protein